MPKPLNILIVEDNDTMREGLVRVAEKSLHNVNSALDAEEILPGLDKLTCDVLVTDYKLPGIDGLELLNRVKSTNPQIEVLLITAHGSIELAVAAMKNGAADFLTKPFSPEEFNIKLEQIARRIEDKHTLSRLESENEFLRDHIDLQFNYGEIIGRSRPMQAVYRTIEKVARGDSSVIIYGESGTGKELVARAIHLASPRKNNAFIRVNCGALTESLLESELFGHEKGAFTGAFKRKKGRFELAQNGSIFLDEIGDISLPTQVKLLRVLQEKEFERVGGEETLTVDARVIAATNKDLQTEIRSGKFREDLYYRLHVIPVFLPPLRERKEDLLLLAEHFLKRIKEELKLRDLTIEKKALDVLQDYDWPGNVREFENVLERAAVLCDHGAITAADLPLNLGIPKTAAIQMNEHDLDLNRSLEMLERQLIERAMDKSDGVKTEAARLLGLKTSALYYKLEKYGMI